MAAPQAYTLHRVTAPAGTGGKQHIKDMVDLHPGFEIGGKTYYLRFHRSSGKMPAPSLLDMARASGLTDAKKPADWIPDAIGVEHAEGRANTSTLITREGVLLWDDLPNAWRLAIEAYETAEFVENAQAIAEGELREYDVLPFGGPPADWRVHVTRKGSLVVLEVKAEAHDQLYLAALESDRRVSLFTLCKVIWGGLYYETSGSRAGVKLGPYLRATYGADSILPAVYSEWVAGNTHTTKRSATSADNTYTFPQALSIENAITLCEEFQPGLVQTLEFLRDFPRCPSFEDYPGPRSSQVRVNDAATLAQHIRHLGALTFSAAISDVNADKTINISDLRDGIIDPNAGGRLAKFKVFSEQLEVDQAVQIPNIVHSTLRLPVVAGVGLTAGVFTLGSGPDAHPRLGCHLCLYSTSGGKRNLARHISDYHRLSYTRAREAWEAASAGWDVLLLNTETGSLQTLKAWNHLWIFHESIEDDEGTSKKLPPLVRRGEERDLRSFGKEGDQILYILWDHTHPVFPLLDDWQALIDGNGDASTRHLLEFYLLCTSALLHLVEPSDIVTRNRKTALSNLGNILPAAAVRDLFVKYGKTTAFTTHDKAGVALGSALEIMSHTASLMAGRTAAPRTTRVPYKLWDVQNNRVDGAFWPLTWATFDIDSLPLIIYPELEESLRKARWHVYLIWRRTWRGGWVLVGAIIIIAYAAMRTKAAKMLRNYLSAGQYRHALIADDLQMDAKDLVWTGVLLDGCPADSKTVPTLDEIVGIEGENDIHFESHQHLFASDGFMDDNEIILSLTSYDGLFVLPDTLISFFAHWRGGYLAFLTEDRRIMGLKKRQAGIYFQVYVYVPAFIHYLRQQKADALQAEARRVLAEEARLPEEIAMQEYLIGEAEKIRQSHLQRDLLPAERNLFAEVCRRMKQAASERDSVRSHRNIRQAARAARVGGENEADIDEVDSDLDDNEIYVAGSDDDEDSDEGVDPEA